MADITPFGPDDKRFFQSIRDDIHRRPDYYREGVRLIQRRFSMGAQYREDLSVWREAQQHGFTGPSYPKPRRHRPTPLRVLGPAFAGLEVDGVATPDTDLRPFNPDAAKAVLVLTWLLTDEHADEHAIARPFGAWEDPRGGRGLVRTGTLDDDEERRGRWMKLAKEAAQCLRISEERATEQSGSSPDGSGLKLAPSVASGSHGLSPSAGFFTSGDLAAKYCIDPETTRKALERWRLKNRGSEQFTENSDRRSNEPQYLYSLQAVTPLIDGIRDRARSRSIRRTKTSGERPAR